MTSKEFQDNSCPAESLLKTISGKWKPQIFRLALNGPVRFNTLLKQIAGSNKQSIAVALKDLEEQGVLEKTTIKLKPLHIEYKLSAKGHSIVPIFLQLESLKDERSPSS